MFDQWYFTQAGQTFGPVTAVHLARLVQSGKLPTNELVWPANVDVRLTAGSYLQMQQQGKLNDWLTAPPAPSGPPRKAVAPSAADRPWWADAVPEAPPKPQPPQRPAVPDWLDEVRQVEHVPRPSPPPASLAVDWLDDIKAIEESLRGRTPQPVAPPASQVQKKKVPSGQAGDAPARDPLPVKPANRSAAGATPPPLPAAPSLGPAPSPPALPRPTASHVSPPVPPASLILPAVPPPMPMATFASLPVDLPAAPPVISPPIATPAGPPNPTQSEMGPRPRNLPVPTPLPGMSVQEVFLAARTGLQEWADAEENKPLIIAGDVDGCLRDPWVRQTLQAHQGFGPVMAEKLIKHFRFLVDNRRGFYASRGQAAQPPSANA